MRVIFKPGTLILAPETEREREEFAIWRDSAKGHVFHLDAGSGKGGALRDIGPREDACREPINVVFGTVDARWRSVSNLALTPFNLRGMNYASVEGFWQGLKFEAGDERARVAALWGKPAKIAAAGMPDRRDFMYQGRTYVSGSHDHHALMSDACQAKFAQNLEAREALLATGNRPLVHKTRRDSKTIPGALMADIWTRIRTDLKRRASIERVNDEIDGPRSRILYFQRDRTEYEYLSHFYPAPIMLDGERWPTVEHYYQAQKSSNPDYRAAIRAAETPGEAKQLAANPDAARPFARRSWFLRFGEAPRSDWAVVKLDIMRRADLAKFSQNLELGKRLLETGTAELVEDSPFEPFWGIGHDGAGENWAGRVLMEVRACLRSRLTLDTEFPLPTQYGGERPL